MLGEKETFCSEMGHTGDTGYFRILQRPGLALESPRPSIYFVLPRGTMCSDHRGDYAGHCGMFSVDIRPD